MKRKVLSGLNTARMGLETSLRKLWKKGSDYKRWENNQNLSKGWDTRTKRISELIIAGKTVIEFGAGRLVLKELLPAGCTYTPSDLVDRGFGTVIWDLNSELLPKLQAYDIAVFSGVLEYVYDVPALVSYLSNYVNEIIASYAVTNGRSKLYRRANGWVNDFTSKEFVELFEKAGFLCQHEEAWQSQLIYSFIKGNERNIYCL